MRIDRGGSGTPDDIALVKTELDLVPDAERDMLHAAGVGVIVCRNSVVDHRPDLAREAPRNWPKGYDWSHVPGCYAPDEKNVIIALVPVAGQAGRWQVPPQGVMHNAWNLVVHETMHASDYVADRKRCRNRAFLAAREADRGSGGMANHPYEGRDDQAGDEESYAESAARYFGKDSSMVGEWPALNDFWARARLPLEPGDARRRARGSPYVGTATMRADGAVDLDLRAENSAGLLGHALIRLGSLEQSQTLRRSFRRDRSPTILVRGF